MTTEPTWRKASFSDQGNTCVELATLDEHTIGLRDSKNPEHGYVAIGRGELRGLVDAIKAGHAR